jgi:hypothetical protein
LCIWIIAEPHFISGLHPCTIRVARIIKIIVPFFMV